MPIKKGDKLAHILRQTDRQTDRQKILDNKNGIALILVVSIMAVLASIAAAFSYSMIMDQRAAANYMNGVKANYIAKAGIQHAIGVLKLDGDISNAGYCNYEGYDWYGDDWGYDSTLFGANFADADSCVDNDGNTESHNLSGPAGSDSRWIYMTDSQGRLVGRYAVLVLDESGKVNINTAGVSSQQNEGWTTGEINLADVCSVVGVPVPSILSARYGTDGYPGVHTGGILDDDNADSVVLNNDGIDNDGDDFTDEGDEGVDDSAEFYIDRPYTDPVSGLSADTPFVTIGEVVSLAGMSGNNYKKLSPYITAWSSDKNLIGIGYTEDSGLWRLNINAVSDAVELYSTLRDACEYWEPSTTYSTEELAQMAVNIIDYRDFNHGSTRIKVENKDGKVITRYGVEGIRINEIMVRPVFRKDAPGTIECKDAGWTGSSTWTSADFCDSGIWSWTGIPIGTYKVHVYGLGKVDYLIHPDDGTWSDTHFNVWLSDTSTNDTVVILNEGGGTGTFMINIISKAMAGESPASWYRVDLSQSPDCEYVEIVNISPNPINIENWRLEFPNGQVGIIPSGTTISKGAYAVLAIDKDDCNHDGISVEGTWFGGAPNSNVHQLVFYEHSTADSAFDDILSDTVLQDSPLRLYDGPIEPTIDQITGIASPAGHIVDQVLYNTTLVHDINCDFLSLERDDPSYMGDEWLNDSGIFDSWLICTDSDRGTPTEMNSKAFDDGKTSGDFKDNVKNSPFANIGEIADVSDTPAWTNIGDCKNKIRNIADRITVSGRRLDAEFADHTNANWGSSKAISANEKKRKFGGKTIVDELYWFEATGSAGSTEDTWTWYTTRDRFEADTYIMYVYGREGGVMKVRVGNDSALITPSADYGARFGQVVVSDTTLSVAIMDKSTQDSTYFDYVLLTPASKTYGRLNINTAGRTVLQALKDIDSTLADAIIGDTPLSSIGELVWKGGAAGALTVSQFKPISNLVTTKSNVFKIICTGQSILDKNGNGAFDVGDDEVLGERKITVIYER